MSNPGELDERHQLVLQAVWDLFTARSGWPVFDELDRYLDRTHQIIDVADLVQSMPPDLLYGVHHSSGAPPGDDQPIGVTVAAATGCRGSAQDLQIFVDAVRLAAALEQAWQPPSPDRTSPPTSPARPVLSQHDGFWQMSLPAAGRDAVLARLGHLLVVEQWGYVGVRSGEDWEFTIGRQVRRFRGVTDVADYLARRSELLVATTAGSAPSVSTTSSPASGVGTTVFLVHGHDHDARRDVAAVIKQLTGQPPVILDEEAGHGRTLVEKFEQHANDVRFAVVLLTPDDLGGPRDGAMRARARQNVVFELGYFFAALQRGNVAVLAGDDIEHPSDVDGLAYIPYPGPDWPRRLAREMEAAGLAVALPDP